MPVPTSTRDLLELVRKSGIYPGPELDENLRKLTKLPQDASQSAALFVKQGMLTKFQAKLLLNGKYRGFRLGSYILQEQLGQGGMGAVYLAQHETLKRQVALKVLPPNKNDPNTKLNIERFLREARAAAALDHPNIVRIHDIGQQGEVHYLVMEYVEGQTLESMLNNGGAIAPSRAVEYIAQAAAGLQHAYEKGFIHRDIKPANLIVAKDGTLKILDMGLARSSTKEADKLTAKLDEGAIVGTADFISPEQALNAPNIDIRSDIYCLGATFFSLVTGSPPFSGNTAQKLVQHQMKEAPSLTTIDKTFPKELAQVVAKMLHKKPEKRYQTPAEVITAVAEWLPNAGAQRMVVSLSGTDLANSVEMQATLSEMAQGGTKRLSSKRLAVIARKLSPKVFAGIGTGAVALALLIGWMVFGGSSEPKTTFASGGGPIRGNNVAPVLPPDLTPKSVETATTKTEKIVDRFEASELSPFRAVYHRLTLAEGGRPKFPERWRCEVYAEGAQGEFRTMEIDGRQTVAIGSTAGKGSSQIVFSTLKAKPSFLLPGRTYETRVTCKLDADLKGYVNAQYAGDYKSMRYVTVVGDGWQTVNCRFVMPETGNIQVTIGNATVAPGKYFYVQRVEVVELPPVSTVPQTTKQTSTVQLAIPPTIFEQTLTAELDPDFPMDRRKKRTKVLMQTGEGQLPEGWHARSVAPGDQMQLFTEKDGERTVLGMRNINSKPPAMLFTPDFQPTVTKARLRMIYKMAGTSTGTQRSHIRLNQSAPAIKEAFEIFRLTPTDGQWVTLDQEFDLKGATKCCVEIHHNLTGKNNGLWIQELEVSTTAAMPEVPVSVAPMAVEGSAIYTFDFQSVAPFRTTCDDKKTDLDLANVLPNGITLNCWKSESVAEFRAEIVNGRTAIGLTNLNDTNSGQIHVHPMKNLKPGKRYRLRMEYLTKNDSHGAILIRLPMENYQSISTLPLPSSPMEWKTITIDFTQPESRVEVDAQVKNNTIGEGNTLYVSKIEVIELK